MSDLRQSPVTRSPRTLPDGGKRRRWLVVGMALGLTWCLVTPFPSASASPSPSPSAPPSLTRTPTREVVYPGMAKDDSGKPGEHHDYVVTKEGVASTFVWIPVFQAYQLIRPKKCGAANARYPVGFWVAKRPARGRRDVDWAVETFGGFYAGKYEASHADTTPGDASTGAGATESASSSLKVAPYCMPWTNVNWDQAKAACEAYDPACHLMTDDEWTALAVWSMIRGVRVYGNNSYGNDVYDNSITFLNDPTFLDLWGRGLTGSGRRSSWSGEVNRTTHTGKTDGVYDLNGNVAEWTSTLGGADRSDHYTVNGSDTGVSTPYDGYISSLSTDARLRRYGVPRGTRSSTSAFGGDEFDDNDSYLTASLRGGHWCNVSGAGVWTLDLSRARSDSDDNVGFRPVLRF